MNDLKSKAEEYVKWYENAEERHMMGDEIYGLALTKAYLDLLEENKQLKEIAILASSPMLVGGDFEERAYKLLVMSSHLLAKLGEAK